MRAVKVAIGVPGSIVHVACGDLRPPFMDAVIDGSVVRAVTQIHISARGSSVHAYAKFPSPVSEVHVPYNPSPEILGNGRFVLSPGAAQTLRAAATFGSVKPMREYENASCVRVYEVLGTGGHGFIRVHSGSACVFVSWVEHCAHSRDRETVKRATPTWIDRIPPGHTVKLYVGEATDTFFPTRSRYISRFSVAPAAEHVDWMAGWGVMVDAYRDNPVLGANGVFTPNFAGIDVLGRLHVDASLAANALFNGTPYPANYKDAVRIGAWHPMQAHEGGETGGYGITQAPGVMVASTGSAAGIRLAMMEQFMAVCRTHIGMIANGSKPIRFRDHARSASDWTLSNPGCRMRSDDGRFQPVSGGAVLDAPFDWSKQPKLSPRPPEAAALEAFEPYDWGHFIRLMRHDITLAYMHNDELSKNLIRQNGEVAQFSLFPRFAAVESAVRANPHRGVEWGRIQGWMLRAIAEQLLFERSEAHRGWLMTALERIIDTMELAWMPNGLLAVDGHSKEMSHVPYSGHDYMVTAAIQHGLLCGGVMAAVNACGQVINYAHLTSGVEYLRKGSQTLWSAASRPMDPTQEPYDVRPMHSDGHPADSSHPQYDADPNKASYDSEQTRHLLSHLPSDIAKNATVQAMLGANPISTILGMGMSATDTDAILLGALQFEASAISSP